MSGVALITARRDTIAELCRRYHVRELSLFGSALRSDFRAESDLDLLVEFEPGARTGLLTLAALGRELGDLLERNVDLVPKLGLKPSIRGDVLARAEVVFAT